MNFLIQNFSGRFDTIGSMVPRLVPEISSLDAFCDGAGGAAGIGDSRSWMYVLEFMYVCVPNLVIQFLYIHLCISIFVLLSDIWRKVQLLSSK